MEVQPLREVVEELLLELTPVLGHGGLPVVGEECPRRLRLDRELVPAIGQDNDELQ